MLERAGESRGRARLPGPPRSAGAAREHAAATEENLRQVLAFEMDRLTPFRAEEVYFDLRVLARDMAPGTLSVLLAVARRELVDARVERLRATGISRAGRDRARRRGGSVSAPLDLLPSSSAAQRESSRDRLIKHVAGVSVVLLDAVLVLPDLPQARGGDCTASQVSRAQAEVVFHRCHRARPRAPGFRLQLPARAPHAVGAVCSLTSRTCRGCCRTTPGSSSSIQADGQGGRELQITGETVSSSR
jgi:hypothetical protein